MNPVGTGLIQQMIERIPAADISDKFLVFQEWLCNHSGNRRDILNVNPVPGQDLERCLYLPPEMFNLDLFDVIIAVFCVSDWINGNMGVKLTR